MIFKKEYMKKNNIEVNTQNKTFYTNGRDLSNLKVTLTARFGMLQSLFLILLTVSYMLVLWVVETKKHDSIEINLAGRQRMLVQKYTKHVNLRLIDVFVSRRNNVLSQKEELEKTSLLFEETLNVLFKGGLVQPTLKSSNKVEIPALEDQEILKHLKHAQKAWENLKKNVTGAFNSGTKELPSNYINKIQEFTNKTVSEMDIVVTILQRNSELKLKNIKTYQLLMTSIGYFLFVIIIIFVYWRIVIPLDSSALELKDERKQYKTILAATPDLLALKDKNSVYRKVNKAFCKFVGKEEHEIIGKNDFNLFSDPEAKVNINNDIRVMESQRTEIQDEKVTRGDGTKTWLQVVKTPILDENGKSVSILHSVRNISSQKQVEDILRKAKKKAEEASKIKSEFLANMSHEIRTPMNGIIGFTDILIEDKPKKEQLEALKIIKKSANNLLEIINNILDISKIESDKLTLEEVIFDIEVLVFDICNIIRCKASEKNIEVLASIEDIPTVLLGDPTRLRQIITNLMGNAYKFTKSGTISLKISLLEEHNESILLKFSVDDTGIGIPEDKVEIIFDPFSQVDGSTTRIFGGTGLGLSISKKLSRIMGGNMWVENNIKKGSTFYFTAKFKKAPNTKKRSPIKVKELFGKHVIIVDDNVIASDITSRLIKELGMIPLIFDKPGSAIKHLEKCQIPPDLGIIDMVMPEMDGLGFIKHVRKSDIPKIPMITITSNSAPGVAKLSKESGFDGYLPKPLNRYALLNIICTVLGISKNNGKKFTTQHSAKEDILKNAYVLLAEDNKVNQKLVVKLLSKLGCSVDIADDGVIVMEKLKNKNNYDLVFMDIQMPNMGGIEATKKIRESNNDIPIIALTANAMKGDRDKCLRSGMNDYISKPLKKEILISKVQEWCRVPTRDYRDGK